MIRKIKKIDFKNGLLETLNSLSPINTVPTDATIKNFISKINKDHMIFVYEKDKKILGCITCFIELKIIHEFGKVAHIEDVAVHHDFQGYGIGKKLLEHVILFAQEKQCYKVILNCSEELISFYTKNGFYKSANQMRLDL